MTENLLGKTLETEIDGLGIRVSGEAILVVHDASVPDFAVIRVSDEIEIGAPLSRFRVVGGRPTPAAPDEPSARR